MKNIRLLIGCALSATALFCNSTAQAQTISTVAGGATGLASPYGDLGPATSAQLNTPYGLAKDVAGNLYIADDAHNLIRKVNPSGTITTVAGSPGGGPLGDGGAAISAHLNTPTGVAVDAAGNLYIADAGNNRVRMVTAATGIITTIAGTTAGFSGDLGPASTAKLSNPRGIVVYPNGRIIYVSDGSNNRIRVIANILGSYYINTIAGNGTPGYGGDGTPATSATAELNAPRGLAVDYTTGNLYIADMTNNRIRMIDSLTGIISTVAGMAGAAGYSGDGVAAIATKLNAPTGIAVDASHNLYIADVGNNRIRYVDNTSGNISTIVNTAGAVGVAPYGDGGGAPAANLSAPTAVLLDGTSGNYYISDQTHNLVRYVNVSIAANTPPAFAGGANQNLVICENSGAASLNTLLQVNDPDLGQTETWSVTGAPAHGTAVAAYTTTSTGSTLTPTGLTYTPTIGYSGNDVFTVQVSDGSATATTIVHVTVNPLPVVAAIAGTTSTVCVGSTISFTNATTGGIWAAANSNASVAGGVVTGAVAGTDHIYYIVSNACGPDSVTALVTINSTAAPSVSISSTLGTSTCGVPGTFTANPIGGGATPSYQWSVNSTLITGATSSAYTYTPLPGDVVSVLMTSSSLCAIPSTATGSITMVAGGTVVPTINITSGIGDTVCVGVPITFTSATTHGGASPSYDWTINGVSSGSGSTFVYTASSSSAGDVIECTLTSSIPCASPTTAISNDVIIQLRSASASSVSITASPGNIVCAGTHVTFTAAETGGGGAPLLRWTRAGVNVATGPTYTTIPNDGDAVYCTMHSSIACSATDSVISNVIGMTVEPVITPAVTVTATRSVAGVGQIITFTATVTSATIVPGYQWYVNGTAVPGATSAHFIYTGSATGSALVNCVVSSGDACNAIGISNLVSITISSAGVTQSGASNSEMKLLPNPNKGIFTMNLQSGYDEPVNVVITNILGEKVKELNTNTNNTIEVTLDQHAGIYFLSATTDHGKYIAKVMVN